MKKRIIAAVLVLAMAFALCGCCLKHDYAPATCTEPETCTKCGKTQGEALGHTWTDATCTEPKTCTVCGETEGEALGHDWADATCTEPKTCTVCGETEGEALGHDWADATCTEPKTCTVCGETEGEALGHDWADATCTEPKTCTVCGETEGEALGHTWTDATMTEPKTCTVCGETEGAAIADEPALIVNGKEHSVAELIYNYKNECLEFAQNYGPYASLFGYDTETDPAEQPCTLGDKEGMTWRDWFIDSAVAAVKANDIFLAYADEKGIELTQDEKDEVVAYIDSYDDYLKGDESVGGLTAYLNGAYGEGITKDMLVEDTLALIRVQKAYSAKSEEVRAAVTEDDAKAFPRISVRHILCSAKADENGEFTDAALKRQEGRANVILDMFKKTDMTEEDFADLAGRYSDDPGSKDNGGLYEAVEPGQMVEEFDAFCFDESRKPGDVAIVYGTNGAYAGYHVMYFVGADEEASLTAAADAAAEAWYSEAMESAETVITDYMEYVK